MANIKICGCYYTNSKGKTEFGIEILNRKTNTVCVINKKLEKVTKYTGLVSCEYSIGNIFMDIK